MAQTVQRSSRVAHTAREREWPDAKPIYVLSQRGPLSFHFEEDGRLRWAQSPGGLSTALGAIAQSRSVHWVAAAHTDPDRAAAARPESWRVGPSRLRLVSLPEAVQRLHSAGFANPLLWFLQHGIAERVRWPRTADEVAESWFHGYVPANVELARQLVDLARVVRKPTILVQDYHLYLAPRLIRQAIPDARIAHFVHIPWPGPEDWSLLPRPIVRSLLDGLSAADLVGFQTQRDARNFRATCLAYGGPSRFLLSSGARPRIGVYPITIDHRAVLAAAREGTGPADALLAEMPTVVRVDRLDPTKNIPAGFRAFGRLLARRPALHGRVQFVAQLTPSRTDLAEYREEQQAALASARLVNQEFGTPDWAPIRIFQAEDRALAAELLSAYDVLLVGSLADGMNLVAKEGAVLNRKDGVLVCSERAGVWEELGPWAVGVDPMDEGSIARGLERALSMGETERRGRAAGLRRQVLGSSLEDWLGRQLWDLALPPDWEDGAVTAS